MDKIVAIVVVCIIVLGIAFWMFNNPSGINQGVNGGATKINTKTGTFDYKGDVAPGTGHTAP